MRGPKPGTPKTYINPDIDKQSEWVYALRVWNELNKNWETFYCGRSIHPDQRKKEHQRAAKKGDRHTVYQFIRIIEELNFDWDLFHIKEFCHVDYNGEEKDHIINLLLENEMCNDDDKLKFMEALFLYKGITLGSFLANEKFGDGSPEMINYKRKLKIMKDNGFKTLKELSKYEEEERNRKKSETLADKIRQKAEQNAKELTEAKTLKARIKANPEFQAGIAKMKEDRIVAEENAKNLMKLIRR